MEESQAVFEQATDGLVQRETYLLSRRPWAQCLALSKVGRPLLNFRDPKLRTVVRGRGGRWGWGRWYKETLRL